MSPIITGILLKSYMAVARLMGSVDKKRKRGRKLQVPAALSKPVKRVKLKEA
ncbi:MAG: hypothetical protein JNL72_12730 [Flavipsychrobacter sp.]|nr:hypothetical protein [Flavipsychrobacter sp.]